MNIHRLRQFALYCFDKMSKEDYSYLSKYLNEFEIKIFNNLSYRDQKHCIRVAQEVEKKCCDYEKSYRQRMIRAALLHDIGKIKCKLNIIDKCALVMLDYITKGKVNKYSNINKINIYYNHGEEGYNILKNGGYDKEFLDIIKNHHNKNIITKELDIIRRCDDIN